MGHFRCNGVCWIALALAIFIVASGGYAQNRSSLKVTTISVTASHYLPYTGTFGCFNDRRGRKRLVRLVRRVSSTRYLVNYITRKNLRLFKGRTRTAVRRYLSRCAAQSFERATPSPIPPSPIPTVVATASATATATATPDSVPTITGGETPTIIVPTITVTNGPVSTATPTRTAVATRTSTPSSTPSSTPTARPTPGSRDSVIGASQGSYRRTVNGTRVCTVVGWAVDIDHPDTPVQVNIHRATQTSTVGPLEVSLVANKTRLDIAHSIGAMLGTTASAFGFEHDLPVSYCDSATPSYIRVFMVDPDSGGAPLEADGSPRRIGGGTFSTLAVIPDTQKYAIQESSMAPFRAMVQDLVSGPGASDIAHIIHVGDLVENGNVPAEFERAVPALDPLKNLGLPVDVCAGNHDFPNGLPNRTWSPTDPNFPTLFRTHVGELFGASVVEIRGMPVLIIWLPYRMHDLAVEFAIRSMAEFPFPTIIASHEIVEDPNPTGTSRGEGCGEYAATGRDCRLFTVGGDLDGGGLNSAKQAIAKIAGVAPNLAFGVCGHDTTLGDLWWDSAYGRRVWLYLFDPQSDDNGGNGWKTLIRFSDQSADVTRSSGYYRGQGPNRSANYAVPVSLSALKSELDSSRSVTYRDADDTFIAPSAGGRSQLSQITINGGTSEAGLLRFPGLSALPVNSVVRKAVLTITVEGYSADGPGFTMYRMLTPWVGSSATWSAFGGNGIQLGVEAFASPSVIVPAVSKGTYSFDVTNDVQLWVSQRVSNYGWYLQGVGGANADTRIASAEWPGGFTEVPALTVVLGR